MAWRSVSNKQKKILKTELQALRGRKLDLTWDGADQEQDRFARQLASVLRDAGLAVDAEPASINIPPVEVGSTGILIEGDDQDIDEVLAKALVLASLANVLIFPMHTTDASAQIRIRPKGP